MLGHAFQDVPGVFMAFNLRDEVTAPQTSTMIIGEELVSEPKARRNNFQLRAAVSGRGILNDVG